MTQPKTRRQMAEEANARVFSAINALMPMLTSPDYEKVANGIAREELERKETTSDDWYGICDYLSNPDARAQAFKVAQAVLVRNAYHDGLPYCPLCGKIGTPKHNGAPLIEAQVCEACNQRKVIPARIRAAQKEAE